MELSNFFLKLHHKSEFKNALGSKTGNTFIMKWYIKALKQFADFKGRACLKEYWMFVLFNTIFFLGTAILDNLLGLTSSSKAPFGMLPPIYLLVVIIPALSLTIRRLHDINKSGFFIFLIFIPFIGGVILFVLTATDGDLGDNRYGPSHKNRFNEIEQIGS